MFTLDLAISAVKEEYLDHPDPWGGEYTFRIRRADHPEHREFLRKRERAKLKAMLPSLIATLAKPNPEGAPAETEEEGRERLVEKLVQVAEEGRIEDALLDSIDASGRADEAERLIVSVHKGAEKLTRERVRFLLKLSPVVVEGYEGAGLTQGDAIATWVIRKSYEHVAACQKAMEDAAKNSEAPSSEA